MFNDAKCGYCGIEIVTDVEHTYNICLDCQLETAYDAQIDDAITDQRDRRWQDDV